MAKISVPMQIDGGFITELARTWLWEENRPYEQAADLLRGCCGGLSEEQTEELVVAVLEGRKKLVGINVFSVEDDNEKIRPLSSLIKRQEEKIWMHEIEDDMQANFIRYVDPYATIKSMHPDSLRCNGNPHTWPECQQYFTRYVDGEEIPGTTDSATFGGLWLRYHAKMVCDIIHGDLHMVGSDEFWRKIYEQIKDNPDFKERNDRYLTTLRIREEKENRDILWENLMKAEAKKLFHEEPEYFSNEWFKYKEEAEDDISYRLTPDDIECWEGLVAPNGDFYSCGFGRHATKAYYLISKYPEKFGLEKTKDNEYSGNIEKCLDLIVEKGWCATREIGGNCYLTLPVRPTKAQVNRIFDAINKHRVRVDTTDLF